MSDDPDAGATAVQAGSGVIHLGPFMVTWHGLLTAAGVLISMAASAHGFATAQLNVYQALFVRPDAQGRADLPLTRADIYTRAAVPVPHTNSEYREVLRSAQFRDSSLGLLKLMEKLGIRLTFERSEQWKRSRITLQAFLGAGDRDLCAPPCSPGIPPSHSAGSQPGRVSVLAGDGPAARTAVDAPIDAVTLRMHGSPGGPVRRPCGVELGYPETHMWAS